MAQGILQGLPLRARQADAVARMGLPQPGLRHQHVAEVSPQRPQRRSFRVQRGASLLGRASKVERDGATKGMSTWARWIDESEVSGGSI